MLAGTIRRGANARPCSWPHPNSTSPCGAWGGHLVSRCRARRPAEALSCRPDPRRRPCHPPSASGSEAPGPQEGSRGDDLPSADPGGPGSLTLGSEVLLRMARLRALDEYRALLEEAAAEEGAAAAGAGAGAAGGGRSRGQKGAPQTAAPGCSSALLLRGALLISRHRYPDLDADAVLRLLDDMAARVEALLPAQPSERYPLRVVAAINRVMYHDFGFRGNQEDYYSADNSCINKVVERRVGIPITLSLVYMEVARRVGLRLRGLNLPGHFMLQPLRPERRQAGAGAGEAGAGGGAAGAAAGAAASPGSDAADDEGEGEGEAGAPLEVLVDAFKGGEVTLPGEAEERISEVLGSPVRIDPQVIRESRPLPARAFFLRMLGNLRSIYLTTQQVDLLLAVVRYMRATLEEPPAPPPPPPPTRGPRAPATQWQQLGSPGGAGAGGDPGGTLAASAALCRDEGLCLFALKRYPECLEVLREYLAVPPSLRPPEEAATVEAVMAEARRRMAGGGAGGAA
ncbi:hypothetical protein HYH03_018898 [Edaphochlamys debaryana]|uniref:Protein SirB1 N-terminal domain-containing protein n=1 Tax=Edaphochlamys debaryana TaxID=47281 RepID=A0A836BNW2_9CHLO|nr:hypothetical protein HYH03_018898 [Edaphochlamys debaryana]|eukprot:KAG2482139.1 hypothetical protein HYH03_018898 [Edaphochlamys debaryana]